jgi:hypothetical protein
MLSGITGFVGAAVELPVDDDRKGVADLEAAAFVGASCGGVAGTADVIGVTGAAVGAADVAGDTGVTGVIGVSAVAGPTVWFPFDVAGVGTSVAGTYISKVRSSSCMRQALSASSGTRRCSSLA